MRARTRKGDGVDKGRRRNESENAEQSAEGPPTTDDVAKDRVDQSGGAFPIVGIGASAGGLEAFTQLLAALPLDTGIGFVLVQHLDPDHESQLTQILSRATSLPLHEIANDEPVKPNHVYVIPRDTNLTLSGGVLKIQPRERPRSLHRSIDSFFESLAQDRHERAVGVVLSGTATDGTLGLEAIKAGGGITFAQDDSAKHSSMPRSAVAAGCVDLVLAPADIAKELARIAKHPYVAGQALRLSEPDDASPEDDRASATAHEGDGTPLPSGGKGAPDIGAEEAWLEVETHDDSKPAGRDSSGYKKILLLLRNHSGVDFSLYKSTTIQRRITRRLVLSKHNTLAAYADFLRGNTPELDALYSDVLISVTTFFRNPETFDVLQEKVFPQLLKHATAEPLRCWVLGCSTGQEAYSIAMAFSESVEQAPRMRALQIFATDLNDVLLDKARHGLYAKSLAEDITPERLRRFFVEEEGGYRVKKALREMVVFARQNLIGDPPFSRMNLISCRNLLIYLEPSLQKKALPTFHYALKPGGFLLLGASESIGGFTELFEPVDKKNKIYSKKPAPVTSLHLPLRKEHGGEPTFPRPSLTDHKGDARDLAEGLRSEVDATREADRISVNQFAPPGVLVNAELQVLQFRGPTGAFLEPPIGKASFDVLKMAREGLMLPLRSAINQAKKDNKTARKKNVRVKRNGKSRTVNLEVIPLKNVRDRCFLILFEEETKKSAEHAESRPKPVHKVRPSHGSGEPSRIAELETELSEMREYLHSMREQHEAANEEVQSANEEVQSSNEELQSINEELETSKEELESANEELTTVNEEMSNRNVELNRLNNDLINLQVSTKLAVVLFGRNLTIRRFSPQAEKQFDLLVADVGRPISHLRHGLVEVEPAFPPDPDQQTGVFAQRETPLDLDGLVAGVIAEVREQEREVRDKAGRWHSLRVRPYMTADAKVDGAVLVLVDVDQLKRSEQANSRLAAIVESSDDAIISTTLGGVITSWNGGAEKLFGYSAAEAMGRHISLIIPAELRSEEEAAIARLGRGEKLASFETERQTKDGQRIPISLTTSSIKDSSGHIIGVSKASRDITERKRVELAVRESEELYRALVEQVKDYAIFRVDTRGRATTWNEGVKRVLGFDREEFLGTDVTEAIFTPEDIQAGVPQREMELAAKDGTASNDRWMRRKDGERFFAAGMTTALKEEGGQVSGFTKVMRDHTETVRADEALRKSEEQLKKYSAELSDTAVRKNEFLAMLGHELRNPLAALSYGLDVLGGVSDDRAKAENLRLMMTRQTKRIIALLDQLLDIARVVSGKVELSKNRVDLADAIRAAVETVQPLLDSQEHELTLHLPSDERVFVVGDPVRLTQIVENILTNAAKYTNKGGQIEVTLESDHDTSRITVRDDGVGMSAELLPHVFEVFTQAPRTLDRAKGGMGLGLPLVQRLVEMHGGRVTADSAGPHKGSVFVVTLPCTHRRSTEQPERLKRESTPVGPGEVAPRRILVVDDEKDAAETLAELLEQDGHETIAVGDGRAALEAVRTFDPEVVLLDIGMPEMDGYEVAKRLREKNGDKNILLIAVTGYQSDAARLKQAGFDEHIIKPPDSRKLTALLTEWDAGKGAAR